MVGVGEVGEAAMLLPGLPESRLAGNISTKREVALQFTSSVLFR